MHTKHLGKWVIVLFLLAALPGLTAVMAQGQEPVVIGNEVSSAPIPWVNTESEPNDSMATADAFQPFQGGTITCFGDADYFKIEPLNLNDYSDTNSPILIDIEASTIGSPLQAKISLYAPDGTLVDSAYYNSATDPLLYYNLFSKGFYMEPEPYYLAVQSNVSGCGNNYKYEVLVSNPLLISAAAANLGTASVDGISFQSGDVLAWSEFDMVTATYEKWNMLLDLSDLGVKGNLTNLAGAWRNSDFLLVGFAANVTLPGVAVVVKPADVVMFDPSQVGPNTTGTFQLWWRGSDHQLTTTAEKLDAIDWPSWGGATTLFASTTGTAAVTKSGGGTLKLPDEDIGLWGPQNVWVNYFDHSAVAGMGAEDVIGLSIAEETVVNGNGDWDNYHIYNVVIQGSGLCGPAPRVPVTQKDILRHVERWGWYMDEPYDHVLYPCQIAWHGPDHGWNYNIDAIEFYGSND